MMERIATVVASRRAQDDVQRLQTRISTLGREVTTGTKADISGELGGETPILIGLREAHGRTELYMQTSATLTTRLDTMQLALSGIKDTASDFGWDALAAIGRADTTSLGNLQASASAALQTVLQQLNVTIAGRHLFSGSAVDVAPMINGAAPNGVITDVINDAAASAGGQLDVSDIAGLVSDLDSVFDDTNPDPTRRYSTAFYQGAPASEPDLVGQLDENTRMTYGLKANEPAFRDIVQGLYMLSAVDFGDPVMTEDAYQEFAGAAVERLQRGLAELVDLAAGTGQNQSRVSDNQERLDAAADLYSHQIVELEKRDPYEAASQLTSLEAQLQTSFAITARMNQLSLVNYLS